MFARHISRFNIKFARQLAALVLVLLSGCAAMPGGGGGSVGDRAQQRWDALLAGNVKKAYGFLSPGYRSKETLEEYQRKIVYQRVRWTSADYIESDCSENTCKVQINVGYKVAGALPGVKVYVGKRMVTENWIETEGRWWYVPNK